MIDSDFGAVGDCQENPRQNKGGMKLALREESDMLTFSPDCFHPVCPFLDVEAFAQSWTVESSLPTDPCLPLYALNPSAFLSTLSWHSVLSLRGYGMFPTHLCF